MAFEGPTEDRQLIRERIDAYADTAFRRDLDGWLAMWCEACVWKVPWGEFSGKTALREQFTQIWQGLDGMAFFTQLGTIEVEADKARSRSYCREILFLKDGGIQKLIGAYDDELVREKGVWLFARRDYRLLIDEGRSPSS